MLIHCFSCYRGMNLKRRNFPGQRFKEVIKGKVKTVTVMGYFCKSCSRGRG